MKMHGPDSIKLNASYRHIVYVSYKIVHRFFGWQPTETLCFACQSQFHKSHFTPKTVTKVCQENYPGSGRVSGLDPPKSSHFNSIPLTVTILTWPRDRP